MLPQFAKHSGKNPYIKQQVMSASPEKLVLILYDIGLKSCRARERGTAARVFVELIACLDFDYKEIATGYFDLYRFALDEVHRGRFENSIIILKELREIWENVVMGRKVAMMSAKIRR